MKIPQQALIIKKNEKIVLEHLDHAAKYNYTGVIFRIIGETIELYKYTLEDVTEEMYEIYHTTGDEYDDNYYGFEFEDGRAHPVEMDNEKPKLIEYLGYYNQVFNLHQN